MLAFLERRGAFLQPLTASLQPIPPQPGLVPARQTLQIGIPTTRGPHHICLSQQMDRRVGRANGVVGAIVVVVVVVVARRLLRVRIVHRQRMEQHQLQVIGMTPVHDAVQLDPPRQSDEVAIVRHGGEDVGVEYNEGRFWE